MGATTPLVLVQVAQLTLIFCISVVGSLFLPLPLPVFIFGKSYYHKSTQTYHVN